MADGFQWLKDLLPWAGGDEGEWTYEAFREQLRRVLNDLIGIGRIDETMRDTLLRQIDAVIASEVPANRLDRLIPATSKLMEWEESSGLGFHLVTDPDPTILKTFLARQKTGLKWEATEARKGYEEQAFLKSLEFMGAPAKRERRRVAEAKMSQLAELYPEMPYEPYREVETTRERATRLEEGQQKRIGMMGQVQAIDWLEQSARERRAEKARLEQRYWGGVWGKFPGAETVTYPFLERLAGSPNLQQYARGRMGEFAQRYAKPRQEWWRAAHEPPPEVVPGGGDWMRTASFLIPFRERQRKLREQDPLKMALEKYPFAEEFLKKPPRQRGFYPGRIAPPARWY